MKGEKLNDCQGNRQRRKRIQQNLRLEKVNFLMRDELLAIKLGEYLQQKRKDKGLSQGFVSKTLGYSSPQFISNIERGLCTPPFPALKQMADLYEIDPEEITAVLIRLQAEVLSKAFPSTKSKSAKKSGRAVARRSEFSHSV